MDISLIAKMKKYDEFILNYVEGDENKVYKGKSLLFYSLSNNDANSRYMISSFLLNKGIVANDLNECGENVLHILLSRNNYDISQTAELCKILIDKGVDINQLDEKDRVPLQYLISSKYTDEELEPIYQVLFAQNNILVSKKNAWGKTPIEIASQMPYRKSLLERMKDYE
ncbi:MAG: ankyrin repeat domain-containing protein [Clostridia bacterium]|nr:ankyrin repeat domain-containing protein [Clostridia bacterium]